MRYLVLCAAALLLSACASIEGYPGDPVDTLADAKALQPQYGVDAIRGYMNSGDPIERRRLRDQIVFGRMLAYDAAFSAFERRLTQQGNITNIGGATATIGLGSAAAMAKSATTKTNLGIYGLALSNIRSEAGKQLYYEKTLPVLLAQMEADRLGARVPIERGLALSDDEYSLSRALSDLQTYKDAGSLAGAISALANAAEGEKQDAKSAIVQIRQQSYVSDDNGKRIRNWLFPGGDTTKSPIAANLTALNTAIGKLNLSQPDLAWVLNGDGAEYVSARAKLVADPALKIP